MATMTSDSQTVATSWLTDEEILKLADKFDGFLHDVVVVDILRDYVRLRKLENAVKTKTNEILRNEDRDGPFELVTGNGPMWIRDTSNRMQGPAMLTAVKAINAFVEIKHLLAEAEKGDAK